jgi:hypothetical protein
VPPVYFSLGYVQPFADMSSEEIEPGVEVVRGDDAVVGLRFEDPRTILRLEEITGRLGIDPARVWERIRGDADVLNNRRAATWGGGGA